MNGKSRPSDVKLTTKQLADELEVSEKTLRTWRNRKVGPPYCREVVRIFYYRQDIEAWRQSTKWADRQ